MMDRFAALVAGLGRRDQGQDLLEYALLCALIAIVATGAVQTLGTTINSALWEVIAAASF